MILKYLKVIAILGAISLWLLFSVKPDYEWANLTINEETPKGYTIIYKQHSGSIVEPWTWIKSPVTALWFINDSHSKKLNQHIYLIHSLRVSRTEKVQNWELVNIKTGESAFINPEQDLSDLNASKLKWHKYAVGTPGNQIIQYVVNNNENVASGKEKTEFPAQITSYKHAHLTPEQRKIYLNAYFETMGFILYSFISEKDSGAIKDLNAWIDCVMETKDWETWSPELSWTFGENLDKSAAYILYNKVSPLICKGFEKNAGTQVRTLKIYSYDDWEKWSIKDKAVYLSGCVDTVASFEMRLKDAGLKNRLRDLQIIIEATGIDGILSDVMKIEFERQLPLPWSISRGLGAARKRVFSN